MAVDFHRARDRVALDLPEKGVRVRARLSTNSLGFDPSLLVLIPAAARSRALRQFPVHDLAFGDEATALSISAGAGLAELVRAGAGHATVGILANDSTEEALGTTPACSRAGGP